MKNFMTNCTFYRDDLKAYSDGELSPLRRALVRRHLTRCASCRKEIDTMTQLTEDLRATEPEDALSPTLREKLLESPLAPNSGGTGKEPVSENPAPQNWGGGASSRRFPAWTFAAVALVAWFICYPLFQKARQQTQMASLAAPMAASTPVRVAQTNSLQQSIQRPIPPPMPVHIAAPMSAKALPPPPKPALTVRLSDREAGAGEPVVHIVNGASPLNAIDGNGNTLNGDPDLLRQVHKEAGIGLQVANPDATGDKLNDMVKEIGGYVAANNLTTDTDGLKSGELIVKVPEAQFETFLAAVAKLGTVVSKNITGEDITEKTSDAHEAQSVEESDLEQAEARLKALGSHAKWEDKEDTQDERVKLAETRARLNLLKRMAALGTITIDLSETPKAAAAAPATTGFTGTLQATTHDALQSLAGSAAALLALVIWLLAYSPIWVPLLLLGRYALKEYKKREAV